MLRFVTHLTGLRWARRMVLSPGLALMSAALAAFAPASALGAGAPGLAPVSQTEVPDALRVPDSQELLFRAFAVGTQEYDCRPSDAATGTAAWVFRQPRAVLVGDDGEPLGIHGRGPFWAGYDGSRVVGSAPVSAPAGDPAHDVPLLLLHATPAEVEGQFATVTFIQRLDTRGGVAPPGQCDPGLEPSLAVPYLAVYYFYGPPAS
jgi:Protein of unknown function (DUF3455)